MKILQIDSARFGSLSIDTPVILEEGLNLWIAENQSGKTTLLTFLEWMLFGPASKRGAKDPQAIKRWTPWIGGTPSGRLVIKPELDGWPEKILVTARFSDYFVQVSEYSTQRSLTDKVTVSKHGEWDLGRRLLNLSRQSFRHSLSATQANVIETLDRSNLRQILTSDLGELVENPDVTTVDRIIEALENPRFTLGDSPPRNMREHRMHLAKELDYLKLEQGQLSQQLNEYHELQKERDSVLSQLEQQDRVILGLEKQRDQLELARNHYLHKVASGELQPAVSTEPEPSAAITADLAHEVDVLYGKLEALEQQISRVEQEISALNISYESAQKLNSDQPDERQGGDTRQLLQQVSAAVETAHREYTVAADRAKRLEDQIPEAEKNRYQSLDKMFAPHREHLSSILEWEEEHSKVTTELEKLRERKVELEIVNRDELPWWSYLGFVCVFMAFLSIIAHYSFMPHMVREILPFAGWIIAAVFLVVAGFLLFPYLRRARTTGPAYTELQNSVLPAMEEQTQKMDQLNRRRMRFIELYKIDRQNWDRLVENIKDYISLDVRFREYSSAIRDRDTIRRRMEAAWTEVGQIEPLAPLVPDMDWLRNMIRKLAEAPSVISGNKFDIRELETQISVQNRELGRLAQERDQISRALEAKLQPIGFASKLREGPRAAMEAFRNLATNVRSGHREAPVPQADPLLLGKPSMKVAEFNERWAALSPTEQNRLALLCRDKVSHDSVCNRLSELDKKIHEARDSRESIRRALDHIRDGMHRFGNIDKVAREMKQRSEHAGRLDKLVHNWDEALATTREIVQSLVNRASSDTAPEIDRAMKSILANAPIKGIEDASLDSNLSLRLRVTGAPADIPSHELWTYMSTGAQQQLALALRLAMARTASGRTDLPLMLDEPLADLDDERAELVFNYITDLSDTTQIIVTTCHQQLYDWLRERRQERVNLMSMPVG
ncbi:MAG: AAA family ATPase [Planctomycetales bacterium]|nr:MAG: AAA family ATPase [Planctomycetales bacterium]